MLTQWQYRFAFS